LLEKKTRVKNVLAFVPYLLPICKASTSIIVDICMSNDCVTATWGVGMWDARRMTVCGTVSVRWRRLHLVQG
jgi:hypothetical protein